MTHSHETREEELDCVLQFKECWTNPPAKAEIREKHGFSQKPHGTSARDNFNYGIN